MATSDAPLTIGSVTLVINDLDKMVRFYSDILGLNVIELNGATATLGQGDNELVRFIVDHSARPYPKEAGLHHTAFLLPGRSALGSWLQHAKKSGVKLEGSADHFVSEAIYLSDPEGNGLEVYADRDRADWPRRNGQLVLGTEWLDQKDLLASAKRSWDKLPDDSVIGHVHLQVGNIARAVTFYVDKLGFERMAAMGTASFYGSGGYHHQLAANIWNSEGSKRIPEASTGLYEIEIIVRNQPFDFTEAEDPWGVKVRLSSETIRYTT